MHQLAVYKETVFERITRWVGLGVLAPLLLILTLPVAIHIAQKPDFGFGVHRLRVVAVDPGGPAAEAGVQRYDRLQGVDGRPISSMPEWYAAIAGDYSLRPLPVTVLRDGAAHALTIQPRPPSQAYLIRSYSLWVTGLAFLVIGWWVLSRRTDPVARNFFVLCLIFAFFLLDVPDLPNATYVEIKELIRTLLQLLLPAYFLRFFLQFPSPVHRLTGEPVRLRLVLLPAWLLFLTNLATQTVGSVPPGSRTESLLELIALIYATAYFIGGLIVFARRTRRRDRPIQRTKMMVILVGLACGLIPFVAAMVLGNLAPGSALPHWQYLALSMILVPASFGLAIMRYGALDRAFVVRAGLIYGILTLVVLLGYFLIVVGMGHFLSGIFHISTYPMLLAIVAASSLAIVPLRRVVQDWIDNAFYPARRAHRQAIVQLADDLTGLIDSEDVITTLSRQLKELFRPTSFAFFLAADSSGGDFKAQPLTADRSTDPVSPILPAASGLAMLLNRVRRPVFSEELENLLFLGESDTDSLQVLTRLETALLVPLITGNRLLGFLAFGPKSGGELYSQEDLANLRTLAVQAGSLVESRRLYQDSLRRKRLETELEVARDIQAQLLPTQALDTATFTIAGRNEPCRMVGGDYFDYFLRRDGRLCFAIADVAGKGIPAALQMTSLRVAFRGEAEAGDTAGETIRRLNAAVLSLVSPEHFVCFFYGIWDPATGLLNYCNAGMDPPVLFRPATAFRQVLKKGGPVLGVATEFHYREGSLALQPGDRLFMYTDGLSEQQNRQGEFFEVDTLVDLVGKSLGATPTRLLDTVFTTVNEFGGEERTDDKTSIVLEIKTLET